MMSGSSEDCFNVTLLFVFFFGRRCCCGCGCVVSVHIPPRRYILAIEEILVQVEGSWAPRKKPRKKPLTARKTLRFNLINLSTYHFSPFLSTFFCQRNHKNPMMRPVLLEFGLIDALDWQTVAASMIPIAIVAASLVFQRLRCRLDVVTWQPPRSSTGRTSRRLIYIDPFWRDLFLNW